MKLIECVTESGREQYSFTKDRKRVHSNWASLSGAVTFFIIECLMI